MRSGRWRTTPSAISLARSDDLVESKCTLRQGAPFAPLRVLLSPVYFSTHAHASLHPDTRSFRNINRISV